MHLPEIRVHLPWSTGSLSKREIRKIFGNKKPNNDNVMIEFYKGHIITLGHGKYDHLSTFSGKIGGNTVEELVKSFQTSRMLCNSCKYNS